MDEKAGKICKKPIEDGDASSSAGSSDVVVLRREIGLWGCVSICVGIMIGSGIFISPKGILQNTGTVGMALVVWVATGVMSGLGALCFAELGTTFAKSGGEYAFLLEAFGPLAAFLRLWANIIAIGTGTIAVLAITFAHYTLAAFFGDCQDVPTNAVRLVAAMIICKYGLIITILEMLLLNFFVFALMVALTIFDFEKFKKPKSNNSMSNETINKNIKCLKKFIKCFFNYNICAIIIFIYYLKTQDTIGNFQRPVFSLGISQHHA